MAIGFHLSGPDNDSTMLRRGHYDACSTCGFIRDHSWIDQEYVVPRLDLDFAYTYDGYAIASEKFRLAADGESSDLHALRRSPGFYVLLPAAVIEFDAERRRTRFENYCQECGRFRAVAGARPIFLVAKSPLPDKLFRTDVEFGSGNEVHPLLLAGKGLAERLASAGCEGLELRPVTN